MNKSIIAVALLVAASFAYAADGSAASSYNTMQAGEHSVAPASTMPAHPSTTPEHKEMKKAEHHKPATAKHIEKKHTEKKASTMEGAAH